MHILVWKSHFQYPDIVYPIFLFFLQALYLLSTLIKEDLSFMIYFLFNIFKYGFINNQKRCVLTISIYSISIVAGDFNNNII